MDDLASIYICWFGLTKLIKKHITLPIVFYWSKLVFFNLLKVNLKKVCYRVR